MQDPADSSMETAAQQVYAGMLSKATAALLLHTQLQCTGELLLMQEAAQRRRAALHLASIIRASMQRRHVPAGQMCSFMGEPGVTITFKRFQRGVAMLGMRPMPTEVPLVLYVMACMH